MFIVNACTQHEDIVYLFLWSSLQGHHPEPLVLPPLDVLSNLCILTATQDEGACVCFDNLVRLGPHPRFSSAPSRIPPLTPDLYAWLHSFPDWQQCPLYEYFSRQVFH